ncbi:MAG: hypothetical protein ACQ5SW_09665 [Sphaerochaetaceae bacterium]
MKDFIDKQIDQNRNLNLFYCHLEDVVTIGKDFIKTILIAKRQGRDIEELISYTVEKIVRILYRINQYTHFSPSDLTVLQNIYRNTFEVITEENPAEAMRQHHKNLSKWLSMFYPEKFKTALRDTPVIGQVVNEEYSPQLQMEIYNIDPKSLREPVLDLGCGAKARLVKQLQFLGVHAIGIDRTLDEENSFCIKKDWFSYTFEKKTWGTIIANMSFTNHLLYTFQNDKEKLYAYLITYKEILASLKNGGCFAYAPSVPMIEDRLDPSQYEVDRIEIAHGIYRSLIRTVC